MSKYSPSKKIIERSPNPEVFTQAQRLGVSPLLSRIIANRLKSTDNLQSIITPKLQHLQSPNELLNADQAARLIADAIESTGTIVLATDYDTDGVTSAWVAHTALIDFFGVPSTRIEQVIGERKTGYGITDEVVERILAINDVTLVISADQGSSDEARIARLKQAGIPVVVTDHHQLPMEGPPPSASCTVNPQQQGCQYDKTIAGCFVIFLVMTQVRQELIHRGIIPAQSPSLKPLLKNVALGTVADCVSLQSANNRAVVKTGLQQINTRSDAAWQAMYQLNDNQQQPYDAEFLGFQVATRINAASRVSDVTTAFKFLTAQSLESAQFFLQQLDEDNSNRKSQQNEMLLLAQTLAEELYHPKRYSLALKLQGNAGIQGIIASRIGEKYGVPTVAMTELEDGYLAGSGRGIVPEIDLRLAFQTIADKYPELFKSMGGHSGAAGCMIKTQDYELFRDEFELAIQQQLGEQAPQPTVETDGTLHPSELNPHLISELSLLEPYGREWPRPVFSGRFYVQQVRAVGETKTHLSMKLMLDSQKPISAIYFNALDHAEAVWPFEQGDTIYCAYVPSLNSYQGYTNLQLRIETAYAV